MYNIDNFCVICGQAIPEGRMVCINCELSSAKHTKKKKPHEMSANRKKDLREKRRNKQKQKDLYMNEYREE